MSFQEYQQGPFGPQQSTNGSAVASLVLGICGFVVCPLVCSILALVYGKRARREIRVAAGRQSGESLATAGIVLGWIGIAFCVLVILLFIAFGALFSFGGTVTGIETS